MMGGFERWMASRRLPESEWPKLNPADVEEFGPFERHPELTEAEAEAWWDASLDERGHIPFNSPGMEFSNACSWGRWAEKTEEARQAWLRAMRRGFVDMQDEQDVE
jgi:hypothetical protein